MRAGSAYESAADKVRIRLHQADMYRRQDDKLDAYKIYRDTAEEFEDDPAGKAAAGMLEALKR